MTLDDDDDEARKAKVVNEQEKDKNHNMECVKMQIMTTWYGMMCGPGHRVASALDPEENLDALNGSQVGCSWQEISQSIVLNGRCR